METYNKLVRDKVPTILNEEGKEYGVEILSREKIFALLEEKLQEEVNEFLKYKSLENLAEIAEVLFGLSYALGYSEEDLLKVRNKKNEERGGYKDGIVLKSVK